MNRERTRQMKKIEFLTLGACVLLYSAAPNDNLHPVEEGYKIWASAVAPVLNGWVKK